MEDSCVEASENRTADIKIDEAIDFSGLKLSDSLIQGLKKLGYYSPSPIQLKAIPLGKAGLDLVVQAKSGTGKTCVFSAIALESLQIESTAIQVIVLAPTREIAYQILTVVDQMGSFFPGLSCHNVIGGLPVMDDKKKLKNCQIAIGTPGRIKQLIVEQILNVSSVRLFILDEADKLLDESFQQDVNWIYSTLPENKQMVVTSATYPENVVEQLMDYMRNPICVRLNATDPALLGIRQYRHSIPYQQLPQQALELKVKFIADLLQKIDFQQALIFSNYQLRAQSISEMLTSSGLSASFISGHQDQQERLETIDSLRSFNCRILVSTDLTARGIDSQNVNLVINVDIPWDGDTYLHRIGRAGRFGAYGAAVSLPCTGKEFASLRLIEQSCNTFISTLPDPIPADLAKAQAGNLSEDLVTVEKFGLKNSTDEIATDSCDQGATKFTNGVRDHDALSTQFTDDCEDSKNETRESDNVPKSAGMQKKTDPILQPDSISIVQNLIKYSREELLEYDTLGRRFSGPTKSFGKQWTKRENNKDFNRNKSWLQKGSPKNKQLGNSNEHENNASVTSQPPIASEVNESTTTQRSPGAMKSVNNSEETTSLPVCDSLSKSVNAEEEARTSYLKPKAKSKLTQKKANCDLSERVYGPWEPAKSKQCNDVVDYLEYNYGDAGLGDEEFKDGDDKGHETVTINKYYDDVYEEDSEYYHRTLPQSDSFSATSSDHSSTSATWSSTATSSASSTSSRSKRRERKKKKDSEYLYSLWQTAWQASYSASYWKCMYLEELKRAETRQMHEMYGKYMAWANKR